MKHESKFGFGQVLRENITGFQGVVVAIPQDWQNFDENRLTDTLNIKNVGPLTVGKPEPEKKFGGPAPRGVDR